MKSVASSAMSNQQKTLSASTLKEKSESSKSTN